MSFALSVEFESGFRLEHLHAAAMAAGATAVESEGSAAWEFPASGLTVAQVPSQHGQVLTEGLPPMRWSVGLRALLTYDLDRNDACHRDVVALMRELERVASARFVLSFQFETPYAVRDEHGLRFLPGNGLPN